MGFAVAEGVVEVAIVLVRAAEGGVAAVAEVLGIIIVIMLPVGAAEGEFNRGKGLLVLLLLVVVVLSSMSMFMGHSWSAGSKLTPCMYESHVSCK